MNSIAALCSNKNDSYPVRSHDDTHCLLNDDGATGTRNRGLALGFSDKEVHYGGNPGGSLITIKNGPTIYHTGDTDVFADMALIPQFHKVDVMLACIGDHFTMGPERAAEAVKLVKPREVIPMHYGTFPVLTGTPEAFAKALRKQGAKSKLEVMKVDETLQL